MSTQSTLFRKVAYHLGLDTPYIEALAKRMPEDERDAELRSLLNIKIERGELHGAVGVAKIRGIDLTSGDLTRIIAGIGQYQGTWFWGAQRAAELRKSRLTDAELTVFYEAAKEDGNYVLMGEVAYWFSEPQCTEKLEESIALSIEAGEAGWAKANADLRGRELTPEEMAKLLKKTIGNGKARQSKEVTTSTKQELATEEKLTLLDVAESRRRKEHDGSDDINVLIEIAVSLPEPLATERLARLLKRELEQVTSDHYVEKIRKVLSRPFSVDENLLLVDFHLRQRRNAQALKVLELLPEPVRTDKIMALADRYADSRDTNFVKGLLDLVFGIKNEG